MRESNESSRRLELGSRIGHKEGRNEASKETNVDPGDRTRGAIEECEGNR